MCGLPFFSSPFLLRHFSANAFTKCNIAALYLASSECLLGCNPERKSIAGEFYAGEGDDPAKLFGTHLK